MAKSIQALREERIDLAKNLRQHYDAYDAEDKTWDNDAQEKYDGLKNAIEKLDEQITRAQDVLDIEASQIAAVHAEAKKKGISVDEANHNRGQRNSAVKLFLLGGMSALNDEQRQIAAQAGSIFNGGIHNAMSTGTGSEGGYTTQNEFASQLVEALKTFGGMRQVSNVIRTATGSQMDWPTTDATAEEGEIVGENAAVSVGETTFGTLAHTVFKYSSKSIALPFELLQDSEIDIESHMTGLLQARLGRITNKHFTVGTGTGQPFGIIPEAATGKVGAGGQTTNVIFDDLVDLEHSVDPAYRAMGAGFMFNDLTLAELKKLKDGQSRPLWLPGIVSGEPDTILNRPYVINQDMAVMGVSAKSIAFGDFSKYVIRDVMAVQLFRMTDSKYTEKGQVGFVAFMRSGGRLIDVGGAVKVYQNAAA